MNCSPTTTATELPPSTSTWPHLVFHLENSNLWFLVSQLAIAYIQAAFVQKPSLCLLQQQRLSHITWSHLRKPQNSFIQRGEQTNYLVILQVANEAGLSWSENSGNDPCNITIRNVRKPTAYKHTHTHWHLITHVDGLHWHQQLELTPNPIINNRRTNWFNLWFHLRENKKL